MNYTNSQISNRANPNSNKTSTIIDSFNIITSLEDYPQVCEKYFDEKCAQSWLNEISEFIIRNENRLGNVVYRYSSDNNDINSKLLNQFAMKNIEISKKLQARAEMFKWRSFKSPDIRTIFQRLTASIESKNESLSRELVVIRNNMSDIYNKAQPCFKTCLQPGQKELIEFFQNEKDYDKLMGFWTSWRNVSGAKIRDLFIKRMNLENKGARENGYTDSASFNLFVDFEENDFTKVLMKLYENILPLYKEIHAYVRYCLAKYYPGKFNKDGPIPAHLLGNVWAQQWDNIYSIIKKCSGNQQTNNLRSEANKNLANFSVKKMFESAEEFYKSIGMYKMTDKFWERSVLEQIPGKIMNCQGSAYDFWNGDDFRIMMCTKKNLNDFTTIHHEMGHIEYFMAYRHLPVVLRGSANVAFHEAIGDTIALAVKTPEHLLNIGLISSIQDSEDFDIEYLMITALEKVVFLPFALTMDSYIWGVYNGSVPISKLNKHWWDLRYKYQGLKPPIERSENDFDPGAKFHIAFGISYSRYFVSFIIQFQFYESMCKLSGYKGPLHRCDFYKSKEAGSKLMEMLKQGHKKHWKETLKILTGVDQINSNSLIKYFEPLHNWLKNRNKKLNIPIGW